MNFTIENNRGDTNSFIVVSILQDTFTDAELEELSDAVENALDESAPRLTLVFPPTSYPFSKVVAYIVHFRQMVAARGGRLTVVQPNEDFRYVLETMSLGEMVDIAPSL